MADQPNFFGERAGQGSLQWDYKSYAQSSSPYQLDLSKDEEPQKTANDEISTASSSEEKKSDNFESTLQPTAPVVVPTFLGQFISRLWNNEESLKLRAAGTSTAKTILGEEHGEALAETVGSAVESVAFFDGSSAPSLGDLYAHQVKYSSIVFLPDAEQDNRIQAYAYYNPLTPYFSGLTSEYPNADSLLFANLEPSYLAQAGDSSKEAENTTSETAVTLQESVAVAENVIEDPSTQAMPFEEANSSYSYSYPYDYVTDGASVVSISQASAISDGAAGLSQTAVPVSVSTSDLQMDFVPEVQATETKVLATSVYSSGVPQEDASSSVNHESQSVLAEDAAESTVEEDPTTAEPPASPSESAKEQKIFTWSRGFQAQQGFSQESESNPIQVRSDSFAPTEIFGTSSETGTLVEYGVFSESAKVSEEINRQAKDFLASSEKLEGLKKSRRGRESHLDRDEDFKSAISLLSPHFLQKQTQSATDSGNSFATRDNARFINASILMGTRRPAERSEADLSLDEATLVRTMDHRLSTVSSSDHSGSGHGDSQQKPDWSLLAQESSSSDGERRSETKSPSHAKDLEDLPNPLVITDSVIV